MIVLFTDFGLNGPYVGQMKAVLNCEAPGIPVIDLFADAPVYNIQANAFLLASYALGFPPRTVFLAVIDPGVGSGQRPPVVVESHGCVFVGPGNGLFDVLCKRDETSRQWEILWRPEELSASFHGRDLFAPVAAQLAVGGEPRMRPLPIDQARIARLPEELAEVIYIDHFGNLITGIRASALPEHATLYYRGSEVPRVRTFAEAPPGCPLCYENSNGLLEVAVNQGAAASLFEAKVGDAVAVT